MGRHQYLLIALATLATCTRDAPPPPPPPPPRPVAAPVRGATGNEDLRVMLTELVASNACAMIRGGFHGLRSADHPDVVTGVLWLRECEISNVGARATFHVAGSGWLWVDQAKNRAGGTFAVRQYVRFGVTTTMHGPLDIAYDQTSHVASIWFTPDRAPDVEFTTIGDIDVNSDGVWSSVVGAVGTLFAHSPEHAAAGQANDEGTQQLAGRLADGLTATVNLCTGLRRARLGRSPKGEMVVADVGETLGVPVEIEPGGVMIVGREVAEDGMTLDVTPLQGAVRLTLVCAKHAETVAAEFMSGRITSVIPVLGSVEVRTKSKLRIKSTSCPVDVVVSPLDNAPARFTWARPSSEIARSTGGPLIRCAKN